jgi:hypothetical protein
VPYALTLPNQYEGQIRTDLTLVDETARQKFLREQARLWRIDSAGLTSAQLQEKLNAHVAQEREKGSLAHAIDEARRAAPWMLAGALFLLAFLSRRSVATGPRELVTHLIFAAAIILGLFGWMLAGWLAVAAGFAFCVSRLGIVRTLGALLALSFVVALVFWLCPAGLKWYHNRDNQPLTFVIFYSVALVAGLVLTRAIGAPSWREHAVRAFWIVGVAVWLIAYFGPYSNALTGQGSKVVLGGIVTVIIIAALGFRRFFTWPALLLLGLIPFVAFNTESYNIRYRLDRISELPLAIGLVICGLLAVAWAFSLQLGATPDRRTLNRRFAFFSAAAWILICALFFQFEIGKIAGCILGALWLAGVLELFRRGRVPSGWSALASVIVLFATFHFVLNGFAFSHVDFRFAANKIIPFAAESWRAPQEIAWTALKYLFVLLPALAVLYFAALGTPLAFQLLQLGWWRELMIVISSLGLAIFDRRGMNELCREEICFWTFLNLALGLLCLAANWRRCDTPAVTEANAIKS